MILCPSCGTDTVPAVSHEFSDTKVTVPTCGTCAAAGIVAVTIKVTGLIALELPAFSVRHKNGLVAFV